MKKSNFVFALLAALFVLMSVNSAFALSDKEYKKMMKNPEFTRADKALNQAWKNAKNSLPDSEFNTLKKNQMTWIKSGRDNDAKTLIKSMGRVGAYAEVTRARAEYINKYVQSFSEEEEEEQYDEPEENEESFNDDDVELPDDIPEIEDEKPQKSSKPAAKSVNLSSEDEAAAYLEEKLTELDRMTPNEELSFSDPVDVNGETCWEFSVTSTLTYSETGRYAVSSNGKIFEQSEGKYIAVK